MIDVNGVARALPHNMGFFDAVTSIVVRMAPRTTLTTAQCSLVAEQRMSPSLSTRAAHTRTNSQSCSSALQVSVVPNPWSWRMAVRRSRPRFLDLGSPPP